MLDSTWNHHLKLELYGFQIFDILLYNWMNV